MTEVVTIIGASEKAHRYAHMALSALLEHGHTVKLVNPFKESIDGHPCYRSITDITEKTDTVTLYVNPTRFHDHIEEVIQAKPKRVIFNPGTEDSGMEQRLEAAGIKAVRACTLVLLSTDQF